MFEQDGGTPGLESPNLPGSSPGGMEEPPSVTVDDTTLSTDLPFQTADDTSENRTPTRFEFDHSAISDEGDNSDGEQIILDPDHPLMIRFQNALGNQLRKRLKHLDIEDRDLNLKLTAKKEEREGLGIHLYGKQQELALCQAKLDTVNQNLQEHTAQRLYREADMHNIRKLYKSIGKDMDETKMQANEMQKDLDNVNLRVFCLLNSQTDVRSDVKIMKRAALKTRQDLTVQEREKKIQDYRVDFLVELIDQKVTEIEMLKTQLIAQKAESFKFKDLVSEASMELQALYTDVRQIHDNWNSTLLGMKRRDEALASSLENVRHAEKVLLCKEGEIEAYRRNLLKCEEKHEKLSYMLNRVNVDIAGSKKSAAKSHQKLDELKINYAQKTRMLQTLEKAISKVSSVKGEKQLELQSLQREHEKSVESRNILKEDLLNVLQGHNAYNKAADYAKKRALNIIQLISKLESDMSMDENSLALVEQNLISSHTQISENKELLLDIHKEIRERNELVTRYETSFNRNHIIVERKQNYMDECNRRLGQLLVTREGNEVSPLENLALNLKKSLRKESNNMLDDQTMWVEKQQELLTMRQDKLKRDLDIKHRNQDILVLTGKKYKLDAAIDKQNAETKFYRVDMRHLRIEMEKLASLVTEKKGKKEEMEVSSCLIETDFVRELKELEVSSLKIQDRLADVNNEKETLLNHLVHLETQASWWERKIQLGCEMKAAVDPKSNENADLNTMKSEMHRMTVRHQSLMKEQERLIRAMEDSVTRREYTVYGYRATVQRDSNILTKSKCSRRIHETKGKIAEFKKEMVDMDNERKRFHNESLEVGQKLDEKKVKLTTLREDIGALESVTETAAVDKYKNLHELVMRQRRSTYYSAVKSGSYKPLYRDFSLVSLELDKERDKMGRLLEVIGQLKSLYPNAAPALDRVIAYYGDSFSTLVNN